ncbi:hypothetical protein BST95_00390 [Halioglobus japonicus]|uniref:carbohydrate deacetylase n=1 Tax=Halioglobus japonicus TaxID=930805 RepID=UPI00097936BE|nr:ChbG/HpnK family deacetylase [Halioglobus japonicus]AQA16906.1 hypothetical protein BST95_00390 [Halioglobus japonicus]GHD21441.1 hypothetical protein GCM10007052_32210 [Halioglobus japonicus]
MSELIINADDFGLCDGVNDAIVELFELGVLTSTTLMVNADSTLSAVTIAEKNPNLGVGLHFNLTLGKAVAPANELDGLVDSDGYFYPRSKLLKRLAARSVQAEQISLELESQYQRMLSFGLKPTHIDSHQHLHVYPLVFDVLANFCASKYLPIRMPWVAHSPSNRLSLPKRAKRGILSSANSWNARRWDGKLKWNDALCSVFDIARRPSLVTVGDYAALIGEQPGGVVELMVHPATNLQDIGSLTRIGEVSLQEWTVMRTPEFRRMLVDSGLRLRSFRGL